MIAPGRASLCALGGLVPRPTQRHSQLLPLALPAGVFGLDLTLRPPPRQCPYRRKQVLEKTVAQTHTEGGASHAPIARLRERKPQSLAAFLPTRGAEIMGMSNVRLIKHEAVPKCGSAFPTAGRRRILLGQSARPPAQAGPGHERSSPGAGPTRWRGPRVRSIRLHEVHQTGATLFAGLLSPPVRPRKAEVDLIDPAFKMQAPDLAAFRPGAEQAFWQAGMGERALAVRRAIGIIAFCRIFHCGPP